MSVGILVVLLASGGFVVGKNLYQKIVIKTNIVQNGRVALDRITRELRQTDEIFVESYNQGLPQFEQEATNSLTFQDGHDDLVEEGQKIISYITYQKNGNILQRKTTYYYFQSSPSQWVRAGSKDNLGNEAFEETFEDWQTIAEKISDFKVWQDENKIIHLKLVLEDKGEVFNLYSQVNPRNL
jgi:hypothetical protein